MIHFRFHIISLVAVFLALAVGIFLGSAVGEPAIVVGLRDQIQRADKRSDARRTENQRLRRENGRLQSFVEDVSAFAVENRLTNAEVVIVAERGLDDSPVDATVDLVRAGGASAQPLVWLEARWALTEPDDVDTLAQLVDSGESDADEVRRDAFEALARRVGRPVSSTPADTPDLLAALVDADFVSIEGIDDADVGSFPAGRAQAVIIDGPDGDVDDPDIFLQEVTAFTARGVNTVAAEIAPDGVEPTGPERGQTVAVVRGSSALEGRVSTVDDLDLVDGRIAAVLALSLQDATSPVVGDYGYGKGASRTVPEPQSP
jgi:hypothetical protein